MRRTIGLFSAVALMGAGVSEASAASLRGSPAAMVEQNQVAKSHGLNFYQTPDQIRAAVARGELVELPGNRDYQVADFVRFPFLQPEVKLFVERLAAQYHAACGQQLVVTSAVRPSSGQPSNAHQLSVHPAGMAVDLRVSDRASCRSWLESTLLSLETRGVLNGIREFHPPHYHVAVFPEQYMVYVAEMEAIEAQRAAAAASAAAESPVASVAEAAGVAAFVPEAGAEPAEQSGSRGGLAAAIALLLAAPFGFGIANQRAKRRR